MHYYWQSPVGWLAIAANDSQLLSLQWVQATQPSAPPSALIQQTLQQLQAYFADPTYRFDLPLAPAASPFQQGVRELLQQIPSGQSLTYGAAAQRLGNVARAIGQACRANPLPIIVPCHRIVAAQGLGGFNGHTSGDFIDTKQWLLNHERQ